MRTYHRCEVKLIEAAHDNLSAVANQLSQSTQQNKRAPLTFN